MNYTIKAHPTKYKSTIFRSRLEARWAAFFDLVGWKWQYEPIDLPGWTPDFRVEFRCGHSECLPVHVLLIEVKPFDCIEQFRDSEDGNSYPHGHPCMHYPFGHFQGSNFDSFEVSALYPCSEIPADASAAFGNNPLVTYWEMEHGAGGGVESIHRWVSDKTVSDDYLMSLWEEAGNMTRWLKRDL